MLETSSAYPSGGIRLKFRVNNSSASRVDVGWESGVEGSGLEVMMEGLGVVGSRLGVLEMVLGGGRVG